MKTHLTLVALLVCGAPLSAQNSAKVSTAAQAARNDSVYRDATTARLFAIVLPGAGHVYAGEYGRGIALFGGTALSFGMAALVNTLPDCPMFAAEPCHPGPRWPQTVAALAGAGLGLYVWVSGVVDAPRAAERANERHRHTRRARAAPLIQASPTNGGMLRLGAQVTW